MAPQILNCQPYSIKCDVWSLGVLVYKCLYGIQPWNCKDVTELVK
jgi:serine/threonine protein kinase